MADEGNKAPGGVSINLGDTKVLIATILTLLGGQYAVNKASISGVENKQQQTAEVASKTAETTSRAAERQSNLADKISEMRASTDSKLAELKTQQDQMKMAQDQLLGEIRWRQGQLEVSVRDLQQSVEALKKGSK